MSRSASAMTAEKESMLNALIEQARLLMMTDEERERQKRSFAYGTSHIENEDITRRMIDEEADRFGR
ncbi:MAG: hypothetical protein AAF311_08575 [Pseudomonadota bacterium]